MATVKHLTTEDLADRLGYDRRTIEDWRIDGKGPKFIRPGRKVRYRLVDVEAWEESLLTAPGPA